MEVCSDLKLIQSSVLLKRIFVTQRVRNPVMEVCSDLKTLQSPVWLKTIELCICIDEILGF